MSSESVVFVLDASPSMRAPYPSNQQQQDESSSLFGLNQNGDTEQNDTEPDDNNHIMDDNDGRTGTASKSQRQSKSTLSATTTSRTATMTTTTTRLSCCKQAIISMMTELMLQSRYNKVAVIVCKTRSTMNHLMDEEHAEYDHLTELTHRGELLPPTIELFQRIQNVDKEESSKKNSIDDDDEHDPEDNDDDVEDETTLYRNICFDNEDECREVCGDDGDWWAGIRLATDVLYEKTKNAKRSGSGGPPPRKIVVFTDAYQNIQMDPYEAMVLVDKLRSVGARLHVIGLDFESSAEYDEPAAAPPSSSQTNTDEEKQSKIKREDESGSETEDEDEQQNEDAMAEDETDDKENDESSNHHQQQQQQQQQDDDDVDNDNDDNDGQDGNDNNTLVSKVHKERFLIKLTEKTGGVVVAASTLQQVLEANKGKRIKKAQKKVFDLSVAPGLVVKAAYYLLMKRESVPSLKKDAVMVDEDGNVMKNDLGEEMTEDVKTITQLIDPAKPLEVVDYDDQAQAVRFGSDLIPVSDFAEEGVKLITGVVNPRMDILGYVKIEAIPRTSLIGPPYAVVGNNSLKANALITSIAQALDRRNQVAICTFYKTARSAPILGALFPLHQEEQKAIHLLFLRLPFKGDMKLLEFASFHNNLQKEKLEVCENLIDSLMLPDDSLTSGKVPSPYHRSWNQTIIQRAIDPKSDLVFANSATQGQESPLSTPSGILDQSKQALKTFRETFPLTQSKIAEKKGDKKGKGKTVHTYTDYL